MPWILPSSWGHARETEGRTRLSGPTSGHELHELQIDTVPLLNRFQSGTFLRKRSTFCPHMPFAFLEKGNWHIGQNVPSHTHGVLRHFAAFAAVARRQEMRKLCLKILFARANTIFSQKIQGVLKIYENESKGPRN